MQCKQPCHTEMQTGHSRAGQAAGAQAAASRADVLHSLSLASAQHCSAAARAAPWAARAAPAAASGQQRLAGRSMRARLQELRPLTSRANLLHSLSLASTTTLLSSSSTCCTMPVLCMGRRTLPDTVELWRVQKLQMQDRTCPSGQALIWHSESPDVV